MSTSLRSFAALVRALPRVQKTQIHAHTRSFHSPFVVLNNASPLTTPPSATSTVSPITAPVYEKQHDHSPEPRLSSSGTHTYVVSEPDPSNTPYQVPSGAYPTSAPYVMPSPTTAPNPEGVYSSTSASLPHPYTTRAVPHNEAGIGESAAVRYAEAPGEMGRRGGSYGGLGLMSDSGTKPAERKPADSKSVA